MIQELEKTQYLQVSHDDSDNILRFVWAKATKDIESQEVFRQELLVQNKWVVENQGKKIFIDANDLELTLSIETQEWVDKNVLNLWAKSGITKVAFRLPEDLIGQLSIEQAMEEYEGGEITTHYFDNEKEALDWLKTSL